MFSELQKEVCINAVVLQTVDQRKHDFYDLVMNYYQARNNQASSEHDIRVLEANYQKYKDLVWELKEKTETVQVSVIAGIGILTRELSCLVNRMDQFACTVKPILRDHLHERPPALKDNAFLQEGPTFQCN